jgi:TRAP-type mannitol/chloroaromatic compound transport system substrate-binding protein
MNRRGFLTISGAAAVAAGGTANSLGAEANDGRDLAPIGTGPKWGVRRLTMVVAPGYDRPGFAAERLAQRLALMSDGRLLVEVRTGAAAADLDFGEAERHVALHPGFAFFAGLPLAEGMSREDLEGWLLIGGGQLLWDELGLSCGLKPLLAGYRDVSALWANVRLDGGADLAGLPVHASGLAGRLLQALGAELIPVGAQAVKEALARGRIQAAECVGSLPAGAPELEPMAQGLYQPGLHPSGVPLTLSVRGAVWQSLTAAEQAIFAAVAAEEHRLSLAEAKLSAAVTGQLRPLGKWPRRQGLPTALRGALALGARAVADEVAGTDKASRRIADSYRAHRRLLAADAAV